MRFEAVTSVLVLNYDKIKLFSLITCIFCITLCESASILTRTRIDVDSDAGAIQYLERFGYLNKGASANLILPQKYSDALKKIQRFAGIDETGVRDEQTLKFMRYPRCGLEDKVKAYALKGSKWQKQVLTYRIFEYPTDFQSKKNQIDLELSKAFNVWSDITPLIFQTKEEGDVDIDIKFLRGEHGDGYPFYARVLAHAFFPQFGGDVHFNDEQIWSISANSDNEIDILSVAAHEFGHSLGLDHSEVHDAVMFPVYKHNQNFRLHNDDIRGIQSLYGGRSEYKVKLYEHPEYSGKEVTIKSNGCENVPVDFDNKVSSVNTGGGCVRLYEHWDCTGKSLDFYPGSRNHHDFNGHSFDNVVSSVSQCFQYQVKLYEHPEYSGKKVTIKSNRCENVPVDFDNKVSSVNTGGGCVRLYEHWDCTGQSLDFYPGSRNHHDFNGHSFDNVVSSVSQCFQYEVKLYEHPEYSGKEVTIKSNRCENVPVDFDNKVSSVNPGGGCVRLYEHWDCTGQSLDFYPGSHIHHDFNGHWFDNVVSSVRACSG